MNTPAPADNGKIAHVNKTTETAQNGNPDTNKYANHQMHIGKLPDEIRRKIDDMDIDVDIAQDTFEYLIRNDEATTQEIINYIYETIDPDDFNNETTPLKIKNHLNRMFMHDLLDFNTNKYELTDEFMAQVVSASNRQKGVKENV